MEPKTIYTIDELRQMLTNLENGISCERTNMGKLKRVKLPIPEEYGGGIVTGFGYENAVRNLIERMKDRLETATDSPTFRECWDAWISIKMGAKLSATTIANYKWIAGKYLLPFFGDIQINKITPDDIQCFYNSVNHLSASISTQSKAILCGIFDRAARLGDIQTNIMLYKYDRSTRKGSKTVLQDADLVDFASKIAILSGSDYLYANFLSFTSLRRGEILALRWENIDFEKEEIHVVSNLTYPNGSNDPVLGLPKDDSSGVVHLNSELARRIKPYQSTGYIMGRLMTKSMFTKMWARIKKAVDLKGATSHSFRGTYATMMNAHCQHVDPKVLQGALRHKTPDLALKVYAKENTDKTRLAEVEYDEWFKSQLKQASE